MGNMYEYVKMAVQNILANKGRSLLTMLGIIIGIASVIMIVSIGDGTTAEMNKTMDNVGGGQIAIMCSSDASVAGEWRTWMLSGTLWRASLEWRQETVPAEKRPRPKGPSMCPCPAEPRMVF